MPRMRGVLVLLCAAVLLGAATPPAGLPQVERDFSRLLALQDQLDVAEARGVATLEDGSAATAATALRTRLRAGLRASMAALPMPQGAGDQAALRRMRTVVDAMPADHASAGPAAPEEAMAALRAQTYARYGEAARAVHVGGDVLDRLTVLTRLAQEPDPARRRELFLGLAPMWATVNGDGSADSPYRVLARAAAPRWRPGVSPVEAAAQELGVPPADLEAWLLRVLERWRDACAVPGEPWDYWYAAGEAGRLLAPRIPLTSLPEINARYHRDLGADPVALRVAYDLDPRTGKTPVAFTTFGTRPILDGKRWQVAQAWVFATYRVGGLDNLVELLHETGHAVHISAIRTRPAFADWPDSDTFTEALGDLLALEAYDGPWQRRYLGAEAPRAANLRAKYASVMLDICWALFEWRVHRDPGADPNAVWTALTHDYLKIAPHPELSWWAARGQLVDAPGYMMNYALGAILVADLRQRCRELRAPFERPDAGMYAWLTERLYRFGLEKTSRAVVEDFLGREISPQALIADLERGRVGETPAPAPKPAR